MTKKSHNKKRNVGIIYEQLLRVISKSLVEADEKTARIAKKIIKKYFKPGTELYKEYRLFNALVSTKITDGSLATKIIAEAKNGARTHNVRKLEREKSKLIKEINYELKNQNIYGQHIKEYRDFATVQTLLNDWRQRGDFKRIVEYESKVHDMLLREDVHVNLESEKDAEVDQLVLKIMTEKFNKKYGLTFNEQQQSLIKEYVFSSKSNPERFETTLESIKEKTIDSLTRFEALCENEYVKNKISPVLDEVKSLSTSNINDETISKFLTVYQLQKELTGDYDG
ncbi:MAG: hypothetical protein CBC29_05645 [Methylococcaceae bacterium TMED69]|nr:MAG: hypothetical protein CBC29_05645 [Methylococcaceae bacterium TMED69]